MKRHILLIQLFRIPIDAIVLFFAFYASREIRQISHLFSGLQLQEHTLSFSDLNNLLFLAIFAWYFVAIVGRLYEIHSNASLSREFSLLGRQVTIWFFVLLGCVYLTQDRILTAEVPRLILIIAPVLVFLGTGVTRTFLRYYRSYGEAHNFFPKTKLGIFIDDAQLAPEVCDKILQEYTPVFLVSSSNHLGFEDVRMTHKEALQLIEQRDIDEVLMLSDALNQKQVHELFSVCRFRGILYREGVGVAQKHSHRTRVDFLVSQLPTIEVISIGFTPYGRFLKRSIDIFLSFSGLLITSPLFLVIAFFIYKEDPSGPVIFKNIRVGKDGKYFTLYKFRYLYWNMSVKDAYGIAPSQDTALALENQMLALGASDRVGVVQKITQIDPRRMKIARYIETFSIDELPQLWNVFIGDMTLVGPRPHQPREVEKYEIHQEQVLTVKPGITGMAQVSGREKLQFETEAALDIAYIEHWSIWLDFRILIKTIFVVLQRGFQKF